MKGKGGNFTLGDDISTKIRGKGNLLSVIQMCEFQKCELREKNSIKLVGTKYL